MKTLKMIQDKAGIFKTSKNDSLRKKISELASSAKSKIVSVHNAIDYREVYNYGIMIVGAVSAVALILDRKN